MKYKITDKNMQTHGGCQWEVGKIQEIKKKGNTLCTDEVFHYYDTPELAVIFNPIHGVYIDYRIWEIEGDEVNHDSLKGGSKWQKIIKEIPIPKISLEQKVKFGIFCSKKVYKYKEWNKWANDWLSGEDRSKDAAAAAWSAAAESANKAAAWSAAWAASAAAIAERDMRHFFKVTIEKIIKEVER